MPYITPFAGPSLWYDGNGGNQGGPMIDGNNQMINDGPNRSWQPQQQTSMSAPSSDPWAGIRPDLVQIYKQAGVQAPGAAGSGFRDASYWNNIDPSQNARLAADLAGNGPDTPGPGDVGNTSGQNQQPNFGGGLSGNIMQLLQQIIGGNSQPQSAPLYNPHQNDQQQHLMGNNGNTAVNNANRAVSSNGTLIGTSMSTPSGMNQGGFNHQPLGYASNNPVGGNNGMPKPKWTPFSNNGIMNSQNTPMGAPTFFSNGNMQSASGKNNATSYTNNIY